MSVIKWEDPPNGGKRGPSKFDSHAVAAALRSRPGVWAAVAEQGVTNGLAYKIEHASHGLTAFRPAGSFEAVTRVVAGNPTTYARYVGKPSTEVGAVNLI